MDKEVKYLYLDDIIPNRFQPRENFDEKALKELAVSIKEHGVIQPIIVRQIGEKYEIIAGERRYKASTMAGLTKIPAIITNLDDKESSKVALIENLQRKDLTPIEEARTYQKILELDALTQEELAKTMGKSQSAVSNKLRLLTLTDEVQDALLHEQISERHARSLLSVEDPKRQVELLNKVISTRMTVRELEDEINGSEKKLENPTISNILPTSNEPEPTITPTMIDINKIKNEAEDIVPTVPKIDFESLLKPANDGTMKTEKDELNVLKPVSSLEPESNLKETKDLFSSSIEKPIQEPLGNNSLLSGMSFVEPPKVETPTIPGISDSNQNTLFGEPIMPVKQNELPVSNSNGLFGNSVPSSQPPVLNTGVTEPIKTVKDAVETIKTSGKKVELEEFDFEDFYQIVIRIDK